MKKNILLFLAIFLLPSVFAASYQLTADTVVPGVFADGNYYFPSTLYAGTNEDPGLGSGAPALYIGEDAPGSYGIYYYGTEYAYPIGVISGYSQSTSYGAIFAKVSHGRALYGETSDTSSSNAAVYGKATGGAAGVYGYDSDGGGYGVRAYSSGKAFYASGADYGLYILDSNKYGVLAYSDSVGGRFIGDSYGVSGDGTYYGGYFSSDSIGVYGVSSSSTSKQCGLQGVDSASGNSGYIGCYNIGIYTPDDADVDGNLVVGSCSNCDIAEHFLGNNLEPGDVVVLDSTASRGVKKTTKQYDRLAAGIVSTAPTITMGLDDGIPIALSGVVPTKVVGKINVGDLLTTSSTAGYAMACNDYQKCQGAVIGKAMEAQEGGKGIITALVMLG